MTQTNALSAQLRRFGAATMMAATLPAAVFAQYAPVDPMPAGQAAMSVMSNKLSGDIASGKRTSGTDISSRCFADSGPGPERRAMEAEYAKRLSASGKPAADAWKAEHGKAYRAQLVAAGKCPASVAQ